MYLCNMAAAAAAAAALLPGGVRDESFKPATHSDVDPEHQGDSNQQEAAAHHEARRLKQQPEK